MKKSLHKTILLALFSAVGFAMVTPAQAGRSGGTVVIDVPPPEEPPVVGTGSRGGGVVVIEDPPSEDPPVVSST